MTDHARSQLGTATIELALVFSLLFSMVWAIISYTLPLILLQNMHQAVAAATRVAALVPVNTADHQGQVRSVVAAELRNQLDWLPARWTQPLDLAASQNISFSTAAGCPAQRPSCQLTIELRYPGYASQPIVPGITLPGIGQIPRLPADLTAHTQTLL
ncbi:TadE/TadG family type IV pilus assembly protein [Perlucidibaca piscinae]|uniref:TadE/TadG family type IV pilus assembly protein n=1 Tax=Perlucidibaca piscinae TaxID=392589 RepID=UPI0003B64114|nr:TadE/TadG family type IV pilus assembly protein [Perlucidibaca piscinae]